MQSQPLIINSHMGSFALAVVGKIKNRKELEQRIYKSHRHFAETTGTDVNETEIVAMLITEAENIPDGIQNVYNLLKGSCSLLLLNKEGIYAARDKYGRTPIVIGKKEGAFAASSESVAFPN